MLTTQEVKIYRLCHHSFEGLSAKEAAVTTNLTPRRVEQILADVKMKAPQLFPILTKVQARDYHLYANEGWTMKEIAENTGRVISSVQSSIEAAIAKGMPKPTIKRRTILRYDESMDSHVKGKF